MRTPFVVVGVIVGLACGVSTAIAQSASTPPLSEGWQLQVTPYLWASSLVGQLGIGNQTADVDASFSNILDHLHFAAMGLVDARRNRVVALTDIFYTDLRGQQATPGPLFSSVNPQQKLFILTPEGGYRVFGTANTSVDVVGGIRFWHLSSELQFQPGVLPGIDLQASRSWVDGIAGLRAWHALPNNWWVNGYADLGAGGSTRTYQLAGTVGVDLHRHFAVVGGYRYLSVNYDQDVLLDTTFKGPLVGFTVKF